MSKETQRLIKLSDQENGLLEEVISCIRGFRNLQNKKDHKSMIGKINIKVYNETIELESVNFKTKTF